MLSLATTKAVSREASNDPYSSDKVLAPSRKSIIDSNVPAADDAAAGEGPHSGERDDPRDSTSEADVVSDREGQGEAEESRDEAVDEGTDEPSLETAGSSSVFLTG
jgi:hypothetical protein